MAAFHKFRPFVKALDEGKHNFAVDQLKVALCAVEPVEKSAVLADLTVVDLTNLEDPDLTTVSSELSGDAYKLVLANKKLVALGGSIGPFQHVVIYNDTTPDDDLIGWYDCEERVLFSGDSLTVKFNPLRGFIQVTQVA